MIFIICILSYLAGIISCVLYKFINEKILLLKTGKQETEVDKELLFECFLGEEQFEQWKKLQ